MNVYDFDNTIYDGESCFHLFAFYLKRRPELIKVLPRVVIAFAKYKAGRVTVEDALRDYAPEAEAFFRSIPDMRADAELFWNTHMKNIKPFYEKQRRDDDLIITASPETTVRVVCERLGIKNLIGSVIDEETGRITRLCMRSNKIKAFFEAYPDGKIEEFYTDSPKNDKPLIDIAEKAFVVKGSRITRIK